jgi:2-pyrone-4,6-dicarboxylate lactonase
MQNAPLCAAPDPQPRPPSVPLPELSCDTHLHICGPATRYDYSADRIYTPPDALLSDYLHVATTLGIERAVFVQPSVYGSDNTAMLDAMAACPLPCRGVAVVDAGIDEQAMLQLHAAGVRGVRLNIVDTRTKGAALPSATIDALAAKIAPLGWHLELLLHVDDFPSLDRALQDLPVDVVLGHLGYAHRGSSAADQGFVALLRLLERGRCWVKLTGPYRLTDAPLPYAPVAGFAAELLRTAPERLLWGSDWPHVMLRGAMPNDGALLDVFCGWVGDVRTRRAILVDNPATLYGF